MFDRYYVTKEGIKIDLMMVRNYCLEGAQYTNDNFPASLIVNFSDPKERVSKDQIALTQIRIFDDLQGFSDACKGYWEVVNNQKTLKLFESLENLFLSDKEKTSNEKFFKRKHLWDTLIELNLDKGE